MSTPSSSTKDLEKTMDAGHSKSIGGDAAVSPALGEDERRLAELGHIMGGRQFRPIARNLQRLPGLIWGFIVVTPLNVCVGLSLAELASSYPVAAGVYHWTSVISNAEWAPSASFASAYLNILAWVLGVASISATLGQILFALINLIQPGIEVVHWKIFIAYQLWNLLTAVGATYGNRGIPGMNRGALVYEGLACLTIAIVCLAKSPTKQPAAAVFTEWSNETGYASMGLAFMIGTINPAYGYTSLDTIVHLAEEIPQAARNLPKAIMACVGLGFITCFLFLICLFFSIQDIDAVLASPTDYPLAEIFRQAAGNGGGIALTVIFLIANFPALPNTQISTSRLVWAVARDGGLPFSKFFAKVDPKTKVPLNAQVLVWFLATVLGALVGFVMLLWVALTTILWCFPYSLPAEQASMNYSSAVIGGTIILTFVGWHCGGKRNYKPPGHHTQVVKA
ncbi:hypothetical protein MNV49_005437 [Pseudohyphozyma bogoriensis]|nr:hypothetical protein MNV49_005437 [Pseudohyphozyma bogoriensis]